MPKLSKDKAGTSPARHTPPPPAASFVQRDNGHLSNPEQKPSESPTAAFWMPWLPWARAGRENAPMAVCGPSRGIAGAETRLRAFRSLWIVFFEHALKHVHDAVGC